MLSGRVKMFLHKEWVHDYHYSRLHILNITRRHFSDLAASVEATYFLNAGLCVFLYILKSGEKNTHFTGKVKIKRGSMVKGCLG